MRIGAAVPGMLIAAMLAGPAAARAEDDDNPGRGVARVSVVNGDVSVRRGDSGDWVAAAVNAALVVEDTIATGPNSRAEVQFDSANVLRLGPDAEVRLSELEQARYQVQVARGTVEFSVLRESEADVDVSTPAVSVRPSRAGRYRIHVAGDQTEVAVRSGEAELYTPHGVERVAGGRAVLVRSGAAGPELQTVSALPRDDFDRWSEDRDRLLERTAVHRHVSPSIYGIEGLDAHGRWVYDPPHGWVWVPRAAPGWAPYRHGRWVWQDWYGWTWVSHDPWGWAPYHWGRWYHGNHGWCWYPGPVHGRHYWRPALVAFFGFGVGRVHVGFGFGRVGWVPLAPYEPYYPWYGHRHYGGLRGGSTYVDRSVNITNVNITNVYRNARVRGGVSGIDAGGFGRGGRNYVRVNESDIRGAGLVRGQLPVGPDRASLRFADREVRHTPRAASDNVRFYSRREAARVERVPFADQQRAFQRGAGGADAPHAEGRRSGPAGGNESVQRGAQSERGEPWRRAGANAQQGGTPAAEGAAGTQRSGSWRRVGEPVQGVRSGAAAAAEQGAPGARRTVPAERGGAGARGSSRQAGEPAGQTPGQAAPPSERTGGDWRRFGERSGAGTPAARTPAAQDAPRSESNVGERRRFGEGSASGARATETAPRGESVDRSRTWRRFGEPAQTEAPVARPPAPAHDAPGGSRTWQRFGEPGTARPSGPVRRQPAAEPRSESPFSRSEAAPRSVRQQPSVSSGGGRRSVESRSGGSRPSVSAPSSSGGGRSAARTGGGGSSAGARSTGGGGRQGSSGGNVSRGDGGGGRGSGRNR
jgi:hypothetical protein